MSDLIGEDKLIAEIKKSLDNGEEQWAIELCDLLINADKEVEIANKLKAEGLMALSKLETNANGRHYYIASAKKLLES